MEKVVIYQGQNNSLYFNASGDVSNMEKLSIMLVHNGRCEKEWTQDDIKTSESVLELPIKEEDTLSFSRGNSVLEGKGIDSSGRIILYCVIDCVIKERYNKSELERG